MVADAEIIPLGTGGRPGRGTGRQRPSQSSRSLAPRTGAGKRTATKASPAAPGSVVPDQAAPTEPAADTTVSKNAARTAAAAAKTAQAKTAQTAAQKSAQKAAAEKTTPKKVASKATRLAEQPVSGAAAEAGGETPKAHPEKEPAATQEGPTEEVAARRTLVELVAVPDLPQTPSSEEVEEAEEARPSGTERSHGLQIPEIAAAIGHAAQEAFGPEGEQKLAQLLAFLRRRVTGDYTVDEYGLDPEIANTFLRAIAAPLAEKWFRVEVRGIENIPVDGGALIVSNHSGTLPLDALVTIYVVQKHAGRNLRALGADLVFKLPFVGELARRGGATLACNEDATRMLSGGELVGVWPEGFKGIGKPYSERYKLQRFGRGGFVSAAVRTGVPIVPCSVVGAEEIYPLIANIPSLARLLGLPYIPITPFFPLLGLLGLIPLPSKWIIEFGEPIRTDAYDAVQAEDPMLTFEVTDQIREAIQQTLYTLLMERKSVFS